MKLARMFYQHQWHIRLRNMRKSLQNKSPETAKILLNLTSDGLNTGLKIKYVVLYVGNLYKPFWTKTISGLAGGSGKVKIWPRIKTSLSKLQASEPSRGPKWAKNIGSGLKSIRGS